MDNTLIRGDINELQCILDFQKRGYYCSIPFSGSCRYDLIVDINDKLYKIQCKASSYSEDEGVLKMSATRSTTNTQRTIKYTYSENEVDYFYTSWKEYGFLIPINEVSTEKYLRIKPPKNGIQSTMSIASDYLMDNVIQSILTQTPIKKYFNNRFISYSDLEEEKLWTEEELKQQFDDRQIRYIKESISKNKMAYNYYWKYKEFPVL